MEDNDLQKRKTGGVYKNVMNKETSKVDPSLLVENKEKIAEYKERIRAHSGALGMQAGKNASVVQKHYVNYGNKVVGASYDYGKQTQVDNKKNIEKQQIDVFNMKGQESSPGDTQPNKLPYYNTKKDNNNDLYNSLRKSYFNLGFNNQQQQAATS